MASTKAKFISKQATGVTKDLAIISQRRNSSRIKQKAINKDKCYNCQKYEHFGQDCRFSDQQFSEQQFLNYWKKLRLKESIKQQPTQNRAYIAAATDDDNNFESKPFCPGVANMVKESKMQAPQDV